MVIVKLTGGLGNQMFQYAMGRAIAFRNQSDLGLDASWFKRNIGNEKRNYSLNNFNIIESIANTNLFLQKLRSKFSFLEDFKKCEKKRYFKEKSVFSFDSDSLCLSGGVYLEGYWQNPKYFEGIKDILCKEFILKKELNIDNEIVRAIQKEKNSVSIHIRRGDYLVDPVYVKLNVALSIDYYKSAIEIISQKVEYPHFFIFSDDIKWAENNFKLNYPTIFVSDNAIKDSEEIILMSKCKHNIIANSSFSWWGAWLNNNFQKIVIAPLKWSGDSLIDTRELVPYSWIRI